MNDPLLLSNFYAGAFHAPISSQYDCVYNPATNEIIARLPKSNVEDVRCAIASASGAFSSWKETPASVRADYLDRIAERIKDRFEEFVIAEVKCTGKPYSLARTVDIPRAIDNFKFFASAIRQDETQSTRMADAINYSVRDGVGVATLITPWNLPIYLLSWKVAPALACGNTVICKPSEMTPLSAQLLASVTSEIGLPDGVFNLIHGFGADVGPELVSSPDVSLVSFTGGTITGSIVGALAAATFKKLSLELGGKNATIVFDDCDMETAISGVTRSSFLNSGQICLCGSRLFIQKGIYANFLTRLVERVKEFSIGDPSFCDLGPLISANHKKKIESYVKLGIEEGGTVICGGKAPELQPPFDQGFYYLPTIITGLPVDARCSREEIFGPVLCVHAFENEKDLLPAVNNTKYGLAGSIWTNNLKRAHLVANAVRTGMLWINCWLKRDLRVPFGGVGESGVGREGGKHSIDFYSELKNICVQL